MKCGSYEDGEDMEKSPSSRREWIEISSCAALLWFKLGLPPRGGSGLKSFVINEFLLSRLSPSSRREWIEISSTGNLV